MKLGHTSLALLVLLVGALVVGSYMLGERHAGRQAGAVASGSAAGAPTSASQLPPNHPPLNGPVVPTSLPARADNHPFVHFRVGSRNVKSLLVDGKVLWIATSGGIIRYDTVADKHTVYDNKVEGILSNGIFHVSKLGEKIIAGTYGGGLSVFDPASGKWKNYNIPNGLADQFVYDVVRAKNGDLWIATWSGVNRVRGGQLDDPDKWDTFTVENTKGGLPNPWVYGVQEGKDGDMWFATEDGLARWRAGGWTNWKHADGLGAPYEVVKDSIQFTSDPARYSEHHAHQKATIGVEDLNVAYNPNYVISIAVDQQGTVWAGTWGAGLARFDGKTWRNFTTADGLPANHIFMLYLDRKGRLWIGTSHGLARLNDDKSSFSVMTTADGLFADNVFSMTLTDDGTLWAGSFGGIARIDGIN
jgi:ligand-binding sensor domain-containing protein